MDDLLSEDNYSVFPWQNGDPIIDKATRFYAQFIEPGDLVFDVGANVGVRTETFLRLGAAVVAVEPLRENIRALYALFHQQGVHLIPRALGAVEGDLEMVVSMPNSLSTLNAEFSAKQRGHWAFRNTSFEERRVVKVTTLDALVGQFGVPAFAKIDVEGYETAVFQGLSQPIPALSFEFLTFYLDSALNSFAELDRLGTYVCNYVVGETFTFALDRWVGRDEMKQILHSLPDSPHVLYGDVYIRFV